MNQKIKIDPYGFREYDARWLYEKDISREGITNLGKGLGTQIKKSLSEDVYDEKELECFVAAIMQLSVPVNIYSALMKSDHYEANHSADFERLYSHLLSKINRC